MKRMIQPIIPIWLNTPHKEGKNQYLKKYKNKVNIFILILKIYDNFPKNSNSIEEFTELGLIEF